MFRRLTAVAAAPLLAVPLLATAAPAAAAAAPASSVPSNVAVSAAKVWSSTLLKYSMGRIDPMKGQKLTASRYARMLTSVNMAGKVASKNPSKAPAIAQLMTGDVKAFNGDVRFKPRTWSYTFTARDGSQACVRIDSPKRWKFHYHAVAVSAGRC